MERMPTLRTVLCLLLLVAAGLLLSCRKEGDVPQQENGGPLGPAPRVIKIQLLLDSRYEPFRGVQTKLFASLASMRPGVDFECIDCVGSASAQRKVIEKSSGLDFLLVFPVDLSEISDALAAVKSKGTKVILLDNRGSANACSTAIFYDERKVGRMAGELIVHSLRQRASDQGYTSVIGRVVHLQEASGGPALKQRQNAFEAALQAEPGITLVHEAPVDASGTDAAARLAEAFRLQKEFDVILCDTDLIAAAAATAVTTTNAPARQNMFIVGVDGALGKGGGVDLVINSQIDATILRPPLVDAAWAVIEKYLDTPGFTPHPSYEEEPQPVNQEAALRLAQSGLPAPKVE